MNGRNWTRRSIEELVRAYMKKHGAGIQDLGFTFDGVMMDSTNVLPTSSFPNLLYDGSVIMQGISVDSDKQVSDFGNAYGKINLGNFPSYMSAVMSASPTLSDRCYGFVTVPFRDVNDAIPTMTRQSAYIRQVDSYQYRPRGVGATYSDGSCNANVAPMTDFEQTTFYMLTMANGVIFTDKDLVLRPYETHNDIAYPNDCPNYDTVTMDGGKINITLPDPNSYRGTVLAHSAIAEMSATSPFNGATSLTGILICDKNIDGTKTIEDYVNDWLTFYPQSTTPTYKY